MDYASVAQQTLAFLTPFLVAKGEELAGKAAQAAVDKAAELGGRMVGWLRGKLEKKPAALGALDELVAAPEDAAAKTQFVESLKLALQRDETLLKDLAGMLSDPTKLFQGPAAGGKQAVDVRGSNNKTIAQQGQGNSATIS